MALEAGAEWRELQVRLESDGMPKAEDAEETIENCSELDGLVTGGEFTMFDALLCLHVG